MANETRVLTVRQPYASLIVAGVKDVENRSTPFPSTVGLPARIAIHASKRVEPYEGHEIDWDALERPDLAVQRAGHVLGLVTVTGSHHADECRMQGIERPSSCSEWAHDDAYHWTLADATPLPVPFAATGRLGLWRLS